MDKYRIWLDGVSNEDVGVRMQGAVEISSAVPDLQTIRVPGRNGDLHIWNGSYKNRKAKVGAYVARKNDVVSDFSTVNEWLLKSVGYRKLETEDDINHYMLARVSNSAEIAPRLNIIAPFEIEFDCMPQRFLNVGDEQIIIQTNQIVLNPTIFTSKPIYRIVGSGDGVLKIGAYTAEFKEIDSYVYYDADTEIAYKGSVNKNSTVNAPNGLPFEGGEQPVNFSGGIASVEIVPRWWEL